MTEGERVVRHGLDHCERFNTNAFGTKRVATTLKGFFNRDSTTCQRSTSLSNNIAQTNNGIANGEEVVDNQNVIGRFQIFFRNNCGIGVVMSEGSDFCGLEVF